MNKLFLKCVLVAVWTILIGSLMSSCSRLNEYSGTGKAGIEGTDGDIIYLQTNNGDKGENAIIAYRDYGDGHPVLFDKGPFYTGGRGLPYSQNAGSFLSDHEIRVSNDKRFLLAVNSGDNSIAVFKIQPDGSLMMTPGSPFASNGETPVSIDQWQQYIIVLNKSNHPAVPSNSPPNYSVFTLDANGTLTPVSKYEIREGVSPGQVHVSGTGSFVYGSNTWGYNYTPPAVRMNLFVIGKDGMLKAGPDAPPFDANKPGALGMYQPEKQNVLFVAFPFAEQFSFYDINTSTGALTHAGDAVARPGCSRFCANHAGNSLFTANTIDNSVSMFDISNAHSPRKAGELALKNSGPSYQGLLGTYTSSQCVSLATSTNDEKLYVISHHTNPDTSSIGNFNYLHTVQVAGSGLQEKDDPVQLPVANKFRPRGLVVLAFNELAK